MRNRSINLDSDIKPIPITPRQLDGLIRLSEAHAKIRLSEEVTREDAKAAIELLKISLNQVGYDEETKTYDIDRITTGITTTTRTKIIFVRESISQLESRFGKVIPIEELKKTTEGKISETDMEDALNRLEKEGFIFKPKKGFIQRM